jgi:hypothetical protein
MKLTREVFVALDACAEGYQTAVQTGNVGKEYDDVVAYCFANGLEPFGTWLLEQKATETYVRLNGSVFTMNAYQVFDPQTGQHTRYATEEEARAALIQVAKRVLANHCPRVVREIMNEHGDAAWAPTDMHETLRIE